MELSEMIENIESKETFLKFLARLQQDGKEKPENWENQDVIRYLGAIESWIEDMDGYFQNKGVEEPKNINWQFIATLFYVGKIYE